MWLKYKMNRLPVENIKKMFYSFELLPYKRDIESLEYRHLDNYYNFKKGQLIKGDE